MITITILAGSIADYKAKLKASHTLEMEIEEVVLTGYWCDETKEEAIENIEAVRFCNQLNGTKDVYEDNTTPSSSWDKVRHVGNIWIKTENGLKVRFPEYPVLGSYKTEANIIIRAIKRN